MRYQSWVSFFLGHPVDGCHRNRICGQCDGSYSIIVYIHHIPCLCTLGQFMKILKKKHILKMEETTYFWTNFGP